MRYSKLAKYKYLLDENELFDTGIKGTYATVAGFVVLEDDGTMMVRKGYAWDGASGPTLDTENTLRASLGHDALYQLIKAGVLDDTYRHTADGLMYEWLVEDGMRPARASYWYNGVRAFGWLFA